LLHFHDEVATTHDEPENTNQEDTRVTIDNVGVGYSTDYQGAFCANFLLFKLFDWSVK